LVAHVAAHAHAFHDTRRIGRGADRTGRSVEHRAVRRAAAGEVMPLDDALEAFAATGPDDVDAIAGGEHRHVHLVARLERIATRLQRDLAANARRGYAGLLEVPLRRLVFLGRLRIDEPKLHGLIAVLVDRLDLRDDARTGLKERCRLDGAVLREQLRHPDLLANESCDHCYFP